MATVTVWKFFRLGCTQEIGSANYSPLPQACSTSQHDQGRSSTAQPSCLILVRLDHWVTKNLSIWKIYNDFGKCTDLLGKRFAMIHKPPGEVKSPHNNLPLVLTFCSLGSPVSGKTTQHLPLRPSSVDCAWTETQGGRPILLRPSLNTSPWEGNIGVLGPYTSAVSECEISLQMTIVQLNLIYIEGWMSPHIITLRLFVGDTFSTHSHHCVYLVYSPMLVLIPIYIAMVT